MKVRGVMKLGVLPATSLLMLCGCASMGAQPAVTVTVTQTVGPTAVAEATPTETPAPTSSPSPSASESSAPAIPQAIEIAAVLESEIDSAYDVQKVTVKNDPNDLIGRPGGYTSAAYIYDENSESFDTGLTIDNGAKIEIFKTARDARTRYNYLKTTMQDNPILGGEYTYIEGPVLLRVAQDVPPKLARQYRDRFREFMTPFIQ